MKIKKREKNGFSFIESMIVVTVMLILMAGVFVNYRQGQNNMNLQRTSYKIANTLRKTETMVGIVDSKCCPSGVCVAGYKYGYGIVFDRTAANNKKYTLFADCDGNGKYDGSTTDHFLETVDLETNIVINQINGGGVDKLNVVFLPPEPRASLIPDSGAPLATASVQITISGFSGVRVIRINKVGMIDLD